jgi:predicted ArsR family transcriptional regulator
VSSRFDDRFFASTRGRIVLLLRESGKTVNDLAAALNITDNAVRAHLLSLDRDQLVRSGGTIPGARKPHAIYELTDVARDHFPRPYGSILKRFLGVLKERIPRPAISHDLRETGRQMAADVAIDPDKDKLDSCVATLQELGGAARLVKENGQTSIRSESCPFGDIVSEHPEICGMAESMIEEIVGEPVREICDRSGAPKCRFLIGADAPAK